MRDYDRQQVLQSEDQERGRGGVSFVRRQRGGKRVWGSESGENAGGNTGRGYHGECDVRLAERVIPRRSKSIGGDG